MIVFFLHPALKEQTENKRKLKGAKVKQKSGKTMRVDFGKVR